MEKVCCICSGLIKPLMSNDRPPEVIWDKGHNAEPVETGRCCDKCNTDVIMARIEKFAGAKFPKIR